ncbi:sensor histidine kinase [Peribacillus sp. B-H-3]|uniref:sensor histidine kinase n=1 Tax=Peribacillus sp. B-H-3 TaxID=3400420 RepID=UPI003B01E244
MFQKTRLRLTILNSIVFIILIGALGRAIYYYTETQIYREVNRSLDKMQSSPSFRGERPHGEVQLGRGPSVIIWGPDKKILDTGLGEENDPFRENEKTLYPKVLRKIQTIKVRDSTFRTLANQVDTEYGKVTVQFIRNVDAEAALLHRLLLIMVIGGGLGGVLAIAAGYFLAGRALIPIKRAWDNQQQFVSDASHELRTPLSVIQSRTDLLFQSPNSTIEEKAVDISMISKETRRLNKLVKSLLTLARSDSNQLQVIKMRFFLNDLLTEIVNQYSDIAAFQGKTITHDSKEPLTFLGDKERIHQLLVILVDNAMKYTEEGKEIRLSCHKNSHSIFLSVEDDGIGIPEEDIPNIFNRFYQVDKSRTAREESGLGLGLSIAKWIIDAHQGTIKVKSELRKGTKIEVIFPKNQKSQ